MPLKVLSALFGCFCLLTVSLGLAEGVENKSAATLLPRERILLDFDWRFAFGSAIDPSKDFDFNTGYFSYLAKTGYGDGPTSSDFDDRAWRALDLPHDWAVEAPFSPKGSTSHGSKAIGRAFPDASIGWYRKKLLVPATDLGRRITLSFDGVFRDSTVWVNGFFVGREPSGYSGSEYDVTDYLHYGEENVIAVRVDATSEEGWFYEGAGIYRHVWWTKTAPLHVAPHGTFVSTRALGPVPEIAVETTVVDDVSDADLEVEQSVVDAGGQSVATHTSESTHLSAGVPHVLKENIKVPGGKLWSIEEPTLYTLVTTLREKGTVVDRYSTRFGIRTVRFDPNQGFFLNDQHVVLKGTNNHQEHAGVGVAIPDALQDYRIATLKEMGSNAYRCSHNPPTPELLDACDRLGMLVIDENRLMGGNLYHLEHLQRMIERDRNHPSVILWSLGNEEWAIEGNITGTRIAATMQDFAHRLDPTRVCTVAISGGREHGISSVLDVMGYNYISQGTPDEHHALFPQQSGVGTEETTTQGTRGIYIDDRDRQHLAPMENGSSGGNCEVGWQYYAARPYLAGVFFWTGFDYRGEPTPFGWPAISTQFGIVDTCGFPKDSFYYLKAWWGNRPLVHVSPHWNWSGREGQNIAVRCDSNCDAVELWLNQKSLGRQDVPRNGHVIYNVKYEAGTLVARGFNQGVEAATDTVVTADGAAAVKLVSDRTRLRADRADVAVIAVSVVDRKGRLVPNDDRQVTFHLEGPGKIIGVGNGDPSSHEPDKFLPATVLYPVEDWRGEIVPASVTVPSEKVGAPLSALGNWLAPKPKKDEIYDLSATFTLDAVDEGVTQELFLPAWGDRASLWINGQRVATAVDTSKNGVELKLETAWLKPGVNRIGVLVTPRTDGRNHIPEASRMGSVKISHPAETWKRKVFNGLAEVIVQTDATPGEIILSATTDGLERGSVRLESKANGEIGTALLGRESLSSSEY